MRKALLTTIGIPLAVTAVIAALWPHDVGGGDEDPYSLDGHTVSQATYSAHARDAMQDEGITEGDVEQAMPEPEHSCGQEAPMDPYISQKLVASKQREMLAESDRERLAQLLSKSHHPLVMRAWKAARALVLGWGRGTSLPSGELT